MMQLAGQLRAPWRHKDAAGKAAPQDDQGQSLLAAGGAVCNRRCRWRRGLKLEAGANKRGVQQAIVSDVGERMLSNEQRKKLACKIKTNKSGRHEHEEDAESKKLIVNLSHSEQMDGPALINQLAILERPQERRAATATAAAIGSHLRRLKLPFVLVALLMALSVEAARVSRRSISEAGHAYNHLGAGGGGVSSRDKQAAAELVARQLLTSYYRNKILSQHMAQLGPKHHHHRAQAQVFNQETGNQHAQSLQVQESGLDGSSWTISGELMPPANSLHELPKQSAANEQQFVAYEAASAASAAQTGATLPVAHNSLAGHELKRQQQQQQQQLTTPTLNKQLQPPAYYEFGLAPTKALQLEPVAAPSEHVASLAQPAPSLGGHPSEPRQLAHGLQQAQPSVQPHAAKPPASDALARNGRQYSADLPPDTSSGDSSSSSSSAAVADSVKLDQSQPEPASSVAEKGVEPRQRRRMFNRILKKAEWNHLFVELSKVFVRYFLDLALKDIIGKQSGGTSSSSDSSSSSSSSSSTSGRKKLDAQSELTDLLKDFVKTAISNM